MAPLSANERPPISPGDIEPQAVGRRQDALEPDLALQRWRFWAIAWPLLCLVFGGVILYQALQGMEERIFQLPFPFIALIFYAIGMAMRRRLRRERRLFYVPAMQTHDRRWSNLLCGVGILFPLAGLFAPLLQNLFSFLPG